MKEITLDKINTLNNQSEIYITQEYGNLYQM